AHAGHEQHRPEGVEDGAFEHSCCAWLAEAGVDFPVPGYLLLIAVADGQQHRLGVVEVAALLAVVLEDARLDDRIDRAGLLAEAAEDALRQVDVIARRAARAVGPLVRFDVDGERRAHRLAELAGDAALFAVGIAPERMQPAETRAHRRLLLGELHRDLAGEDMPSRQREPLEQLDQHERAEEFDEAIHVLAPRVRGVARTPRSPASRDPLIRGSAAKAKRVTAICSTGSASRGR